MDETLDEAGQSVMHKMLRRKDVNLSTYHDFQNYKDTEIVIPFLFWYKLY